ncbi:hypothetical protein CHARACLAT_029273 [Characodon lateralis]|uniref:Uncharacterized protein n=1 Tax=Characodon lateralis TaxID=208331 RepID=A0ABU7EPY9_9TELE|nr:hypothetical protein [Characodon lateralis]
MTSLTPPTRRSVSLCCIRWRSARSACRSSDEAATNELRPGGISQLEQQEGRVFHNKSHLRSETLKPLVATGTRVLNVCVSMETLCYCSPCERVSDLLLFLVNWGILGNVFL